MASPELMKGIIKHIYGCCKPDAAIRRVVPFLWSEAGQGKTALVSQAAEELGINFIAIYPSTFDSAGDITGLPEKSTALNGGQEKNGKSTVLLPPEWLPVESNVKKLGDKGILFIDELNRANQYIMQSMFPLVLQGEVGPHRIVDGWQIVAAGNPFSEEYQVRTLDKAFIDRFCHLSVSFDKVQWSNWASKEGINEVVQAFVLRNESGKALTADTSDGLPHEPKATPRSWEMFNRVFTKELLTSNPGVLEQLARGILGLDTGMLFIKSLQNEGDWFIETDLILNQPKKAFDKFKKFEKEQRIDAVEASHTVCVTQLAQLGRDEKWKKEQLNNFVDYLYMVDEDGHPAIVNATLTHLSHLASDESVANNEKKKSGESGRSKQPSLVIMWQEMIKPVKGQETKLFKMVNKHHSELQKHGLSLY